MHIKVAVVINEANDAADATTQADAILDHFCMHDEYEEHFEEKDHFDIEEALDYYEDQGEDVPSIDTTDDDERLEIAKLIGEYFWGDEDAGLWNAEEGAYGILSTQNPYGEFDGCLVGGRWTGLFKARSGATDFCLGESSWTNAGVPVAADRADVIRISDIDFQGTVEAALNEARTDFEAAGDRAGEPLDSYLEESTSISAVVKDDTWILREGYTMETPFHPSDLEPENWNQKFAEKHGELSPNNWLILVDCHI